jgi:YidC/Oxa1 family membrane protein insertase
MNIKEWIFPLILAIASTFLMQYFIGSRQDKSSSKEIVSGQSFAAPVLEQINKPLLLDVVFEKTDERAEQLHQVITKKGTYTFSSKGAILQSFNFPWQKNIEKIDTIGAHANCFLIGLKDRTPLYYNFIEQKEKEEEIEIVYQSDSKEGLLIKTFVLHQDSYIIDVSVEFRAKQAHSIEQIRLFISNPVMTPGVKGDQDKGFVNSIGSSDSISLDSVAISEVKNREKFWYTPKTFGFESKFLIHALLPGKENQNLTQRAYFKKEAEGQYLAILESSEFEGSMIINWQTYIGPKTVNDLEQSASFLIATLNYGWFAPISKGILILLKMIKEYLGSYGWAIILFVFLIKLLFMPFMIKSEKSMRSGQEFGKKMEYVKQKYKHDPVELQRAQAELIKKHGVPGLGGCLPMLLNIPMFFALNKVLANAIELHGASFLWIPNLSAPDPYYILSILTGVGILCSPIGDSSKGVSQKLIKYCLALFLSAVTAYLASGLVLFIAINSLMSILQTQIQKRLG